jgi:hypothetical protein
MIIAASALFEFDSTNEVMYVTSADATAWYSSVDAVSSGAAE